VRVTRKRAIVGLLLLLFVGGVLTVVGVALDWPTPRLLAFYGLPGGGPTGRTFTNDLGMELVEISRGYYRTGSHCACEPGSFLGTLLGRFGIGAGRPPRHDTGALLCPPEWIEVPRKFWISRHPVRLGAFARFRQEGDRVEHPDYYVLGVTWDQADGFCRWLSEGADGRYRLPTEAEWEYVLRGGERAPPEDGIGTLRRHPERLRIRPAGDRHPWGMKGYRDALEEWCDEPWDRPCPTAGPTFLLRSVPAAARKVLRSSAALPGRRLADPGTSYRGATFRVVFEPKE
jgi:formylglycine-generating enzyme required for sulfatase activity